MRTIYVYAGLPATMGLPSSVPDHRPTMAVGCLRSKCCLFPSHKPLNSNDIKTSVYSMKQDVVKSSKCFSQKFNSARRHVVLYLIL